ncbi:MOP flippase family protein [Peribacillus frigoritolerans]|uniref:MOP flippase family protein n=1 Tax=Peribacillus frigoritolerans TaxID=450367 RepID=UPI00207A4907|nr:MOP flippase family protein [Peribacillus frigoritolerans]USK78802.1 MOP flippase family protein [Peribacillus frigoritolerans]
MVLSQKAIKGATWTALSTFIISGLSFAQIFIISMLLGPKSLGIISILLVVIGFAQMLYDMGLSNAVIQKKNMKIEDLSTLYWTNFIVGIAFFFLIMAFKGVIAEFYMNHEIESLLSMYSIVFLIIPFGQQYEILLKKELAFNILSKIDVTSNLIGTSTSILLMVWGYGIKSVVIGYLLITFVKTVLLVYVGKEKWKPKFLFKIVHLKSYLNFGLYQMGESSINYFSKNLDFLIIGKVLGTVDLGYYTLAYNIVMIPVSKLNPIVTKVLFPLFSTIQDNSKQIKRGYLKMLDLLGTLNIPIYIGIIITASSFIELFFGEKWSASLIYFQLLAYVGLIRTLENPVGTVILAKGKANYAFYFNLIKMIIMIPVLISSAKLFGGVGIASSMIVIQLVSFFVSLILLYKLINLNFKEVFSALRKPFYMNLIMLFGVVGVGFFFNRIDMKFIFQIVLGVTLYSFLVIKYNNWIYQLLPITKTNK